MITTIIITVVVSVTLTLVLGYFIWSGISARKLKKEVKDNVKKINGNSEIIKNVEDILSRNLSETQIELSQQIAEESNTAYDGRDELHNSINEQVEIIYRQMDKRFDSVYKKIEDLSSSKK